MPRALSFSWPVDGPARLSYPGHRVAPRLGHVTTADQEIGQHLMTPGEVPTFDMDPAIGLLAGQKPVQIRQVRYYAEQKLNARRLPPPENQGDAP